MPRGIDYVGSGITAVPRRADSLVVSAEPMTVRPGMHETRNLAILKIVFTRMLLNSNCLTGPCPRVLPQVHDEGLAPRANCASESRLAWLYSDPAND